MPKTAELTQSADISLLPSEVLLHIGNKADIPTHATLCLVSRYFNGLFKPSVDKRRLLDWVARADHPKIERMLLSHPELMAAKIPFIDPWGREFSAPISAFQYALWTANHSDVVDLIMLRIAINIPAPDKRLNLLQALQTQHQELQSSRLTYSLHGTTYSETHYDFTNIAKRLHRSLYEQDHHLSMRESLFVFRALLIEIQQLDPGNPTSESNPPPIHISKIGNKFRKDLLWSMLSQRFAALNFPIALRGVLINQLDASLSNTLQEKEESSLAVGLQAALAQPIPPDLDQAIVSALNILADKQHATISNSLSELIEHSRDIQGSAYSTQCSLQ
jgi:hypothetical protein